MGNLVGHLLVVFTVVIAVGVLLFRDFKIKVNDGMKFLQSLKNINKAYINVFKQKKLFKIVMDLVIIVSAEVFLFTAINAVIVKHLLNIIDLRNNHVVMIISYIVVFIVVYYIIGYFLLFTTRIQGFIKIMEDKNFRIDFIISYFIIVIYIIVMALFPTVFKNLTGIILVGTIISYYLDMRMMLKLMINPSSAKSMREEHITFTRIIVAAILILVMIIIDLFFLVVLVNNLKPGAFTNINGTFSMFYYTIITFTTIGYGDIVPLTMEARLVAIVISVTSVICITIFLSTILSYRDAFKKNFRKK